MIRCSEVSIVNGDESLASFLVGLWREETHKFVVLLSPLHDSYEMEAPGTTAKLLDHSTVTGVASIDSMELNSGEMHSVWAENADGFKEIGRARKI
jgi:hypothetical protein